MEAGPGDGSSESSHSPAEDLGGWMGRAPDLEQSGLLGAPPGWEMGALGSCVGCRMGREVRAGSECSVLRGRGGHGSVTRWGHQAAAAAELGARGLPGTRVKEASLYTKFLY